MRIAIINWSDRLAGGVEHYLQRVIPEIQRRGHELLLMCEDHAPVDHETIINSIPVLCARDLGAGACRDSLRNWKPRLIFAHGLQDPALQRRIVSIADTVFYAHYYFGTCISGRKSFAFPSSEACDRKFGPGCLARYHLRRCGGLSPMTMLRMYRRQSARLDNLRRCRAIVTATEHMRQEYLRHGFAPQSVFSVRHPMIGRADVPESTLEERSIGESLRLTFVGRIAPEKGGDLLIDALPQVAEGTGRRVALDIVGDGHFRGQWERHAEAICHRFKQIDVRFKGWCRSEDVGSAIAGSHLLIAPSVWPEPFGQVGIEAGLNGIPSVGFALGGIPEWLHEGVNGHLAAAAPPNSHSLAQAILRCVTDERHYQRLCIGARSVASEYSLENHVDRLEGIFESTLSANR